MATLAGISSAYLLRLKQGRDTTPSGQIVEALAQALRLDRNATEYLRRLASSTGSRPPQSTVQTVTRRLRRLVDQIPFPAIVCNRYLDVLAADPYARALTPGRRSRPQPHVLGSSSTQPRRNGTSIQTT